MSIAYLLSGSNQGDRAAILQSANDYISEIAGDILHCSPMFESPPWGFDHPTSFINQAIKLQTPLEPQALLELLLEIENKCGRVRNAGPGYQARTLDIDILFYDDRIIKTAELDIPHPSLHIRRFTLLPLSRIAPDLKHPVLGKSITELLNECKDNGMVNEYPGNTGCQQKEVSDAL